MEKTQIILTVILLIVELVAFWLIIDIQKVKETRYYPGIREANFKYGGIDYGFGGKYYSGNKRT